MTFRSASNQLWKGSHRRKCLLIVPPTSSSFTFCFLRVSEPTIFSKHQLFLYLKDAFMSLLSLVFSGCPSSSSFDMLFTTFTSLDAFQGLPLSSNYIVRKEGNLPSSRCSLAKAETARLYCLLGSQHPLL